MIDFLIIKPPIEPKLEDYGLTESIIEEDKREKAKKENLYTNTVFGISLGIIIFYLILNPQELQLMWHMITQLWFIGLIMIILGLMTTLFFISIPIYLVCGLFFNISKETIIQQKLKTFESEKQKYEREKRAYDDYVQSKKKDYWFSLSGHDFEYKFANLYKSLGYKAEVTKGSGDAGIDIILERDGEKICVQCKAHKKPVGPATVRELYGAMHSSGFNQGILVCLGGFTSGVYDFVKDKPIKLVDIDDVIKMVNE